MSILCQAIYLVSFLSSSMTLPLTIQENPNDIIAIVSSQKTTVPGYGGDSPISILTMLYIIIAARQIIIVRPQILYMKLRNSFFCVGLSLSVFVKRNKQKYERERRNVIAKA